MVYRVYVGRLTNWVREKDIERFFKPYGRIRNMMLKNGFCFVEFEDYRDADDAVYELNGRELCGERVIVEHARGTPRGEDLRRDLERGLEPGRRGGGGFPPNRGENRFGPPTRTDHRVIIENLSSRVSWQDLKDFMRQAGEVTYADAHRDNRNEGVVEFATRGDMKRAIEKLNNKDLQGRRIRVIEDKPSRKRDSRRSPSHSPSRSRSRSRQRSKSQSASRSASPSPPPRKGRQESDDDDDN